MRGERGLEGGGRWFITPLWSGLGFRAAYRLWCPDLESASTEESLSLTETIGGGILAWRFLVVKGCYVGNRRTTWVRV